MDEEVDEEMHERWNKVVEGGWVEDKLERCFRSLLFLLGRRWSFLVS